MTGNLIRCVVCRDDVDEESCINDRHMGGLVCPECKRRLLLAHEYLVEAGVARIIKPSDINQFNFKRFQSGYHEVE